MRDGSEHSDVLLAPFWPLDVVGPQGDIYRAAKRKVGLEVDMRSRISVGQLNGPRTGRLQ